MPGATALLVVAFGFAIAGELPAAAATLIGAILFGAVEVAGHPQDPPKFRDRYGVENVRPRDDFPSAQDFADVRHEMGRHLVDDEE